MFNFIAAALMTHLLVNVLMKPGQQSPETREFAPNTWLPQVHEVLRGLGWEIGRSPLNLSAVLALAACALVWFYLWHTRWGYELRALGHSETAAVYAGIPPARTIVVAMSVSGALAGLVSLNEVMGVHHRLLLNFVGGAGYVGIAVSLMGRNHPVGIVLASVLFGALYQGGSELSFDMPKLTRDLVVVIQGLIILVCGALEYALRGPIEALFRATRRPGAARERGRPRGFDPSPRSCTSAATAGRSLSPGRGRPTLDGDGDRVSGDREPRLRSRSTPGRRAPLSPRPLDVVLDGRGERRSPASGRPAWSQRRVAPAHPASASGLLFITPPTARGTGRSGDRPPTPPIPTRRSRPPRPDE